MTRPANATGQPALRITQGERRALYARAGNRCMICGDRPRVGGRALCVDHCHESGTHRGVLCQPCNVGLGGFRDRIDLLLAAVGYLSTANERAHLPERLRVYPSDAL